jgi:uncharacterized membrane protein YfcA
MLMGRGRWSPIVPLGLVGLIGAIVRGLTSHNATEKWLVGVIVCLFLLFLWLIWRTMSHPG